MRHKGAIGRSNQLLQQRNEEARASGTRGNAANLVWATFAWTATPGRGFGPAEIPRSRSGPSAGRRREHGASIGPDTASGAQRPTRQALPRRCLDVLLLAGGKESTWSDCRVSQLLVSRRKRIGRSQIGPLRYHRKKRDCTRGSTTRTARSMCQLSVSRHQIPRCRKSMRD